MTLTIEALYSGAVGSLSREMTEASRLLGRVEAITELQPAQAGTDSLLPWLRRTWLSALVHGDAFRFDPVGYIQGIGWRIRGLKLRSRHRFATLMGRSPHAYALWIAGIEPRLRAEAAGERSGSLPKIIPVIDCTRASREMIDETLESIRQAGGDSFILVGGERCSGTTTHVRTPADLRTRFAAEEAWFCPIVAGDRFALDALEFHARAAANARDKWLIYADDDLIHEDGRRAPHFKTEWNADLFEHHDFVSGSAAIRVIPEMLEGLDPDDWLSSLVRRALGRGTPVHLPFVLHHRRSRPGPVVPAKPLVRQSGPMCSIIIPTRNRRSLLECCIEGVTRTTYANKEVIVVDNGTEDAGTLAYLEQLSAGGTTVFKLPGPFNFSALNNAAVARARGEVLCFLNNDVEILDADWLSLMIAHALRPELGAIGARLLYPDRTVQHAGVVTGVGGGAAHAHRLLGEADEGYFQRHRLPQKVSAVTAACMVIQKHKFLAVGGFDEQEFPVAFNDVDLCLKLNERGWQSFYEPRSVLIHHESKSRGRDSDKINRTRFAGELAALKQRWKTDLRRDPYHHPQLSPFSEQFFIAV
jgi:GT2 family glycosyltransferase